MIIPFPRRPLAAALAGLLALGAAATCPARAEPAPEGQSADPDTAIAAIGDLLRDRRAVDALARIERLAARHPDDDRFYRLRVLALADLGDSHRAWTLYRARPELFDTDQAQRLEADRLARLVLWSRQYAADEAALFADALRAEAAVAEYLRETGAAVEALPPRIRFDRLILLNRLQRHADVAAEYRAMEDAGHAVPGYALGAVGESLLALQRPEEAEAALARAIAVDPHDVDLHVQRAYAALEQERHADARAQLRALRDREPAWPYRAGATRGWRNWNRYHADVNLALVQAYGEDLPQAQAELEALAAMGPADPGLHSALGTVYLIRGRPARALERFRMATTLDERDVQARIGQVQALVALQRDDLARPVHDVLLSRHVGQPSVQRMDRAWRMHRGWQWSAHVSGGRDAGAGAASPLGSRDREFGAEVRSPLLDDRWRLVAGHATRWADYEDGRVEDRRTGAGVRYAHDRLDWGLWADRADAGPGRTGVGADLGWRFDDAWSARATVRRDDPDASMQARGAGIAADSVAIDVDYAPSERTRWTLGATRWRYDDGNRREALAVALEQRLATRPHLLIDGLAGAYASRGSRDDAPYFNPSRDVSMDFGLRADHLVWRRYERHFRHRLTLGAGPYRQRGFGTAWVPSARYEHEWRFGPGQVLTYGLTWSRPVYDGRREERIGFEAGFRWGE